MEKNINNNTTAELPPKSMEEMIYERGNEIQMKQTMMHTLISEEKNSKEYIAAVEKDIEKMELEDKDLSMEELELWNFKKRMLAATKARLKEIKPHIDYLKEEFFKLFNV